MEWIIEGVALTFVAALVLGAMFILGTRAPGARFVYGMSVSFLLVFAFVSLITDAKASPLPYKLCAPIFTASAVMVWIGGFIIQM